MRRKEQGRHTREGDESRAQVEQTGGASRASFASRLHLPYSPPASLSLPLPLLASPLTVSYMNAVLREKVRNETTQKEGRKEEREKESERLQGGKKSQKRREERESREV